MILKKIFPQWVKEDFADFVLEKVNPTLALHRVLAEVTQKRTVGDLITEITLQPNDNFKGATPGQFVLVTVTIKGVKHLRAYSVIRHNATGLTLGAKQQGLVSNHIAQHLNVGDIIEVSQADGHFTLQDTTAPALFIAGGSGITAILALVQNYLRNNGAACQLIYFAREHAFVDELKRLEKDHAQFSIVFINTLDETSPHKHVDEALLKDVCIRYTTTPTYVCGPAGLISACNALYQDAKAFLHTESFTLIPADTETSTEAQPVQFTRSQKETLSRGSLLETAEQAGLKPSFGCRMGVCNSCSCKKVSGVTKNVLTGEINSDPNVHIKLCVNHAISPVTLSI